MVGFMQLSYTDVSWLLGQERCIDASLVKPITPFLE